MEKISVIVPVYNVEKYLNQCIKSILGQTYSNLEIILVDDGSVDESGKLCDEWGNKDKRIKVIHQNNQGLSAARNAGIKMATAEYIAFVDSDDFLHPKMYEFLYKAISQNEADISICKEVAFEEDTEVILQEIAEPLKMTVEAQGELLQHYLEKFSGPLTWAWNKLYRRSLIEEVVFQVGKSMEDITYMAQVTKRVKKAVWVDARLYFYRQRSGSIMNFGKESLFLDYGEALIFEYNNLKNTMDEKFREALLIKCLTRLAELETKALKCNLKNAQRFLRKQFHILYDEEHDRITGVGSNLKLMLARYIPSLYRMIKQGVKS